MAADVSIIVETNAKEVGNEFTGMAGQIVGTVAKVQMLKKTMDDLSNAMNSGRIDGQQYSKAIAVLDKAEDQLYASIGKTNTAVKAQSAVMDQASASTARASGTMSQAAVRAQQMAAAQRMAGKSTNKFGLVSQQVGYQVGDFFVQVQSGTDALVAFGQQGTQLAGLLPGLAGAILGIGLSLGTAMLNASLTAKGLRVDFKAVFEDLKKAVEPIQPLIDAMGNALSYMGQIAVTVFKSLIDNLDRVVAYTLSLATLLAGKLVLGWLAAGGAASAFFAIVKRGLAATGIGLLVIALGEVYIALAKLQKATGSWGEAFSILYQIADEAFRNMDILAAAFRDAMTSVALDIEVVFLRVFVNIQSKLAELVNFLLSSPILESVGIDLGQKAEDWIKGADPANIKKRIDQAEKDAQDFWESATSGFNAAMPTLSKLQGLSSGGSNIDTSDWLVPDTDDKDGTRDSMKTFMELLDKLKGETANQEKLLGVYGEKREVLEQVISFEDELKRKLTETEVLKLEQAAREKYRIEERGQLLETMTGHIKSAFMSVVDGSKSVVDAFRSMLRNIILAVYEQKVAQPAANAIGSLIDKGIAAIFSANGNVFNQGMHVKAYADGGVVNRATAFPMRGGVGIMGEAGPEAIMPLKRGKNGKLGVQMENSGGGAVTIHQSFNFSANGDESVKRIIRGEVPRITEATKAAVVDAKRRGGSYGRSF